MRNSVRYPHGSTPTPACKGLQENCPLAPPRACNCGEASQHLDHTPLLADTNRLLYAAIGDLTMLRLDLPRHQRGGEVDTKLLATVKQLRGLRDDCRRALGEVLLIDTIEGAR